MNIAKGDVPILPHHVAKVSAIATTGRVDNLHDITITQVRKDRLKESMPAEGITLAHLDLLRH